MLGLGLGLALSSAAAADPGARDWIAAGALATLVLLFFFFAFADRVRSTIGSAASPNIDAHNKSQDAHPREFGEIRQAIAILNNTIVSLQRQIDTNDKVGAERFISIQRQLELAIELLEADKA